jgi:hypothetical protein
MSGTPEVWTSFSRDPRVPEHRALLASDTDRDIVHLALTEAYADGRLDREEFDARTAAVTKARTLGELPALLEGLVVVETLPAVRGAAGLMTTAQLEERALAKWREERRSAVAGFVFASAICWAIWAVVMFGGFPWPVFVMLGTGINALRTATSREEMVAAERRRLEKKQRKELDRRRTEEDR